MPDKLEEIKRHNALAGLTDIAYLLRRLEAAEAIVQYVLDTLPPVDQELFDAWQRSKEEVCLALRQLEVKP